MSRHRVRLAPRADKDFLTIAAWIAERSRSGVDAWLEAYERAEQTIGTRPFACSLAHESAKLGRELYETTFGTRNGARYRIVFVIREEEIVIVRIRGAGQQDLDQADVSDI